MGTSKQKKGWGTLVLLGLMLAVSSCVEKKSSTHETESAFDYFVEECNPGHRSGIVGGQAVRSYDSDSNRSVLLIWKDRNGQQRLCSSTLIAERTLLTAAHCVNEAAQMQAIFYTDVTCDSGYQRSQHSIPVSEFTFHPDYKTDIKSLKVLDENPDLALVRLSRSAPSHFPIFKITESPEALISDVYLYGYGVTGTENNDPMLMRKTVVRRDDIFFNNKAVFFDQKDKTGVCSGDSGGAGLMNDNGELVLASVNSEVFSGNDLSDDLCNRYSKSIIVHHYLNWIVPVMAKWGQSLK